MHLIQLIQHNESGFMVTLICDFVCVCVYEDGLSGLPRIGLHPVHPPPPQWPWGVGARGVLGTDATNMQNVQGIG